MHRPKRKTSGLGAKKAQAAPIVIDLLDDDDIAPPADVSEPTAAEPTLDESSEEEEVKPKPKARPAKRTAKKTGKGKATASTPPSEPSSLPIEPEATTKTPSKVPIRRAATLPISQMRSRTRTPIVDSPPPNETVPDQEAADDTTDTPTMEHSQEATAEEPNSPDSTRKEPEIAKETKIKRQSTLLLPSEDSGLVEAPKTSTFKFTPISTSAPSKIPPTPAKDTSTERPIAKPTGSSSLFRFSGSINVDIVKNASTGEDLDHLLMDEDDGALTSSGKSSQAPPSSLRASLTGAITLDDDSDDDEFEHLLPPRKVAKYGGSSPPSASQSSNHSSNGKGATSPSQRGTTATSGSSASSVDKKATKTAGKPKRTTSTSSINADLLLEEILGPNDGSSGYTHYAAPPATQYDQNSAILQSQVQLARSYLQSAARRTSSTATPPAPSYSAMRANPSLSSSNIEVSLKIGSRSITVPTSGTVSVSSFLQKLESDDKLPVLLPNEQYFLKFDNLPLDPTATLTNCLVAHGDELVLSVRRDGKEVPDPFEGDDQDGDEANENLDKISLTAKFPGGKEVKYRISRDEPLSKLRDAAAKRLDVDPATVQIRFDGDILNLQLSANELDEPLEEDDMLDIEVRVRK